MHQDAGAHPEWPNPRNPIQQSREGVWNKTETPYPSSAAFWSIFIGGIITSTGIFGGHTCNVLLKFVFLSITASSRHYIRLDPTNYDLVQY